MISEKEQSVNTAVGCGILIDILRASDTDDAKSVAAECLARLAHMKSGKLSNNIIELVLFYKKKNK